MNKKSQGLTFNLTSMDLVCQNTEQLFALKAGFAPWRVMRTLFIFVNTLAKSGEAACCEYAAIAFQVDKSRIVKPCPFYPHLFGVEEEKNPANICPAVLIAALYDNFSAFWHKAGKRKKKIQGLAYISLMVAV